MQETPLPSDDAPAGLAAGVEAPAPLITGETPYLVTGFVAVLVVMALIFILLGRWRVAGRTRNAATTADFFQPAGDGAEITFEEADPPLESPPQDFAGGAPLQDAPGEAPKKKGGSPFAGLFAKRDKREPAPIVEDPYPASIEETPYESLSPEETPAPAADWAEIERDERRRAEEAGEAAIREERRRLAETEEERRYRAAEEERRWAERDAAARRADDHDSHRYAAEHHDSLAAHNDIVRTLSEVEEALHVQREAIQAETRSLLDNFARRFSERLDMLAHSIDHSVERRAVDRAADFDTQARRADAAQFEEVARRLDDHRGEVTAALGALAHRLDSLAAAPSDITALRSDLADIRRMMNGAALPTAPALQLSDIVRNALPPGGYDLDAALPNNRRADCLIRLARPPGPIAIDARFPVEAFHALHERRGTAAENEFRRIALHHIVDVAERLICPGFTADSALLFLPTESMVAEIHARFPDIVQDSYRARIWIVSPTTLMATLHTLGALLRDAPRRGPDGAESVARQALAEVDRLSRRLADIETGRAPAARAAPDLRSVNDQDARRPQEHPQEQSTVEEEFPEIDETSVAGDAGDFDDGEAARHARPPFPLR